jgi:hypothetical protein
MRRGTRTAPPRRPAARLSKIQVCGNNLRQSGARLGQPRTGLRRRRRDGGEPGEGVVCQGWSDARRAAGGLGRDWSRRGGRSPRPPADRQGVVQPRVSRSRQPAGGSLNSPPPPGVPRHQVSHAAGAQNRSDSGFRRWSNHRSARRGGPWLHRDAWSGQKFLRYPQGRRRWWPRVGRHERPQTSGWGMDGARTGRSVPSVGRRRNARRRRDADADADVVGADYEADCPVEGVCGARTAPVRAPRPPGRGLSNRLSAAERRRVRERRTGPAHDVGVVAQVLADPEGCRAPARVAPRVQGGDRVSERL